MTQLNDNHTASADFPPSHATLRRHPIHPMLIPFPIAFLVGTLISDVIFALSPDTFWAQASYVLILAGLVSGVLAAIVGSIDFWASSHIRSMRAAWVHMLGNGVALLLALANALSRANANASTFLSEGILLSLLTVLVLAITGWFGGELVFKHRVGVERPGEL